MAKPSILTRLVKGKAIGAFPDFVATWNYIVDFVENLRGDGDDDSSKHIRLDRTVEDRPVILLDGEIGGGGSTIKIIGTDGSNAMLGDPQAAEYKTLTFASKEDSNVKVEASGSDGNVTLTIGVYYK